MDDLVVQISLEPLTEKDVGSCSRLLYGVANGTIERRSSFIIHSLCYVHA